MSSIAAASHSASARYFSIRHGSRFGSRIVALVWLRMPSSAIRSSNSALSAGPVGGVPLMLAPRSGRAGAVPARRIAGLRSRRQRAPAARRAALRAAGPFDVLEPALPRVERLAETCAGPPKAFLADLQFERGVVRCGGRRGDVPRA